MKTIPLSMGKVAVVDDEDYEWLNQWKWFASKTPYTFYAIRNRKVKGKHSSLTMHVAILKGKGADHRDSNGLNNTRSNLRLCSKSQNAANGRMWSHNTSGYKGVAWDKSRQKWHAGIMVNQTKRNLGRFRSKVEAAKAYDAAAVRYFGEFARTNKMMRLLP